MGSLERALLSPRNGPGVCTTCFNFTDGYECCYSCANGRAVLDAVAPISYSVAGETVHKALSGYKRLPPRLALPLRLELARIVRRFLERHESCLAGAATTPGFDLVTTVPSGDRDRDEQHPLRQLISVALAAKRARHKRLLCRTSFGTGEREYDFLKYIALGTFDGESVLLFDDTWTTGANIQSACAALKAAGAGRVAALVIGRHVHRDWHENDRRLSALEGSFDWNRCALCARTSPASAGAGLSDRGSDSVPPGLAMTREQDIGLERLDRVQ